MKVNLPMNMSPTGANIPAKSAGRPDPEAMGLFSTQMNTILSQSDEKGGVGGGGYSQSGPDECDDDTSGSISNTNAHEIESNVTVRCTRIQKTDTNIKEDTGDKRESSGAGMKDSSSGINGGTETEKSDNSPRQFEEYVPDKTESVEKMGCFRFESAGNRNTERIGREDDTFASERGRAGYDFCQNGYSSRWRY